MIDRYRNRIILKNDVSMYEETFARRGLKFINHYSTANFKFPNKNDLKKFETIKHIWKDGDKYYKLADTYYGDSRDWWIIAKYNLKPTESHIQVGDIIYIPVPLITVLNYMLG